MSEKSKSLEQRLIDSGERDRLRELLRQRLSESGWHNQIRQRCRDIVRERGVENVTVEELVATVTPEARKLVGDDIKKELLNQIKNFLVKHSGVEDF